MALGLVGLNEVIVKAGGLEEILLIGLHEIASVIAEALRLDDDDAFDISLDETECHILSFFLIFDTAGSDIDEMLPVFVLLHAFADPEEFLLTDPAVLIGNFLRAADLEALVFLDGADEVAGIVQGFHGTRVKPGIASAKQGDMDIALFKVHVVEGRDLKFASLAGPDLLSHAGDTLGVEVETGDGIVGFRISRLLLDGDGVVVLVELDDAEAFRITDIVAEDRGSALLGSLDGVEKMLAKAGAVEDVVAKHHGTGFIADEVLAEDEGLGKSIRTWLNGVGELESEMAAVS